MQQQSFLGWIITALGWKYILLLGGSGALVFVGAVVVICTQRRLSVVASYAVWLLLPLLLGAMGFLEGIISSLSIVSMSQTSPKPSEIWGAVSLSLVAPFVALLLTMPSYLLFAIGLTIRSLSAQERRLEYKEPGAY